MGCWIIDITIGTFNLNNLFSRYNFKGEIGAIQATDTIVDSELKYEFSTDDIFKIRTYRGKLVEAKDQKNIERITDRIKAMNVDVLAVQEVEDLDTFQHFNREYLNGMYKYTVLVEGNDPRLIDVGVLSKFPIGGITSWKYKDHPDDPGKKVFGRDLFRFKSWTIQDRKNCLQFSIITWKAIM